MFTIARPESFFSFLNVTCQRDMSRGFPVGGKYIAMVGNSTFRGVPVFFSHIFGRKHNFSRCSGHTLFCSENQVRSLCPKVRRALAGGVWLRHPRQDGGHEGGDDQRRGPRKSDHRPVC